MMFNTILQRIALALVASLAAFATPASTQTINEDYRLALDDAGESDSFGGSVALDGTRLIVGTPGDHVAGAAYQYDLDTRQLFNVLRQNDPERHDTFGSSVAVSGNVVIVGNPHGDDPDNAYYIQAGAAYIMDAITGEQLFKLLPDERDRHDFFGLSVAIDGNIAIVGVHGDGDFGRNFTGSAYLFDTTTGEMISKLLADDGARDDQFGISVAISGTTALVGAHWDNDNGDRSGSAYLFDTTTGQQIAKLLPEDGDDLEYFGNSVAIDGTTAVVGAWFDSDFGYRSGSAYLFDTTTGQQITKLLPEDGDTGDFFGYSVAISGNAVIVGALGHDHYGSQSGSAYLFNATTGRQIAKLIPSLGNELDNFGESVAISGTTAVVGAPGYDKSSNAPNTGMVFVYDFQVCYPDLTNDGTLDSFDVSAFLTAYNAQDTTADFNADGSFNFFDVSAFVEAYLNGCP